MGLYINYEHCTSLEQLKGYFNESLTPDSATYADLLDYGKHGDIAVFLRQIDQPAIASRVETIPEGLGDSDFYHKLKEAVTGKKPDNTDNLKPAFDKCFRFDGVRCETTDNGVKVYVKLCVFMRVDEEYEITVSCDWGKRGTPVNPSHFSYNKTATIEFIFCKRANREIGKIIVSADGKELSSKLHSSDSNEIKIEIDDVSFTMIRVEHGNFMMGVIPNESMIWYHNELPLHEVVLTKDYYIGKYPVTRALWKTVMGDDPTKDYIEGDPTRQPVNTVSWNDCQLFIDRLNTKTGMQFRFPTEAEWEFAAKGGIKSMGYLYSGSDNIDEVASYFETEADWPMMHKYTRPNELGIYDMSGTVWEWCQDWYAAYVGDRQTDPTGPDNGTERVVRGGSWGGDVVVLLMVMRIFLAQEKTVADLRTVVDIPRISPIMILVCA